MNTVELYVEWRSKLFANPSLSEEDLKKTFKFKPGQYLTLRDTIDDEDIRRSYSLCSSPLDHEWKVAVKKIPDGKFSTFVNETLKKGDVLKVMKPMGRFGIATSETPKNYIFFTAGSGITPILSILKTHLEMEPNSTFKLFYLNRTVKSIIFKEEIEQLRNQYFGRIELFYFLTKEYRDVELFNGRFSKEKLEIIFDKLVDDELELGIMLLLIKTLRKIEDGEVDQSEGSVEIGKILKQIYIDKVIVEERKEEKSLSWNTYKKMMN